MPAKKLVEILYNAGQPLKVEVHHRSDRTTEMKHFDLCGFQRWEFVDITLPGQFAESPVRIPTCILSFQSHSLRE